MIGDYLSLWRAKEAYRIMLDEKIEQNKHLREALQRERERFLAEPEEEDSGADLHVQDQRQTHSRHTGFLGEWLRAGHVGGNKILAEIAEAGADRLQELAIRAAEAVVNSAAQGRTQSSGVAWLTPREQVVPGAELAEANYDGRLFVWCDDYEGNGGLDSYNLWGDIVRTGYMVASFGETTLTFDLSEFEGMTLAEAEEEALRRTIEEDNKRVEARKQ